MNMDFSKSITFSLILVLSVIVLSDYVSGAKQLPCNRDTYKEVDRILSRLNPLGNPDVEFPESVPDAIKHCNQNRRIVATIEDLNRRCMKGLFKQVVSVVIYSIKKERKTLCRKTPTKELHELLDTGKCVNKARSELEKCAKISIERMLGMKNADQNLKIPLACCEVNKVRKCMVGAMKKTDTCTDRHIDTLITHSETLSGSALKLACRDYGEGSNKCDSLKGALPARRKNQPIPKSLLLPIIDLIESIE